MASPNVEEYLEALYRLMEKGKPLATGEIAAVLKIAPPSVTEMLSKLDKMGYVKYAPHTETALTQKGLEEGRKVLRRHRLWETFLVKVLGVGKEEAHDEACSLEHTVSSKTEDALCRMLQHPEKCPDNEIIPVCDKDVENCTQCTELAGRRAVEIAPLTSLREGSCVVIRFLRGGKSVVQRLADMGLSPGTVIKIVKSAPFSGPVEICARSCNLALGRGVASKIFVSRSAEGKEKEAKK
ncbi:MAG: metal-dependent transcriptional regulator [Candidatus Thermoplasmatota archaeon]|nr:metal-dependent transcriptional regulator [Candidatus Thermoplasmatota archaeon]